jgi:AraC-like DNA-binding protein
MKHLRSILFSLYRRGFLIIIPLLACVFILYWFEASKTLTICPVKAKKYVIQTYSDASENGKTSITEAQSGEHNVSFEFTLRKCNSYSYAGIKFILMVDSSFLDISQYDHVLLDIEAGKAKSLSVYLKAFMDGVTRMDQFLTHEFLMKEITVDSTRSLYTIDLNEFVHPPWWLEDNHFIEANLGRPHLSKIISMEIQNGISTPFDVPIKIVINKIAFVKDNSFATLMTIGITLLYFFILMLVFIVVQRKIKGKQTVIPYKELVVENDADKDMQRVMNAVAKHFADPEFSVEKLAREAGVSASRIPGMLKERFDMNFKQYLNIIRITEAKRLLRETDNQITTCAYNVGYNNIPHFNRTFKQLEGTSPKEYRKRLHDGLKS